MKPPPEKCETCNGSGTRYPGHTEVCWFCKGTGVFVGPEDDGRAAQEAQAKWEETQARSEADAENFHSRYDE